MGDDSQTEGVDRERGGKRRDRNSGNVLGIEIILIARAGRAGVFRRGGWVKR
jgi:hypothetical protein